MHHLEGDCRRLVAGIGKILRLLEYNPTCFQITQVESLCKLQNATRLGIRSIPATNQSPEVVEFVTENQQCSAESLLYAPERAKSQGDLC